MMPPEREVLERLRKDGVAWVLDALLDQGRLVRLANAVGLSYPGRRVQSQKRERILDDLAAKALSEEGAGRSVVRALRKHTAEAAREWTTIERGYAHHQSGNHYSHED